MPDSHQFQYVRSHEDMSLVLLNASMTSFSYGTHSHEEYSLGVTLCGQQNFYAQGQFQKSHPGNVMMFSPDDAHDGSPGDQQTLTYKMLYVHPNDLAPAFAALGIQNIDSLRSKTNVFDQPRLRQQILRLATLIEDGSTRSDEYTSGLFNLAEELVVSFGEQNTANILQSHTGLERAKSYLQDHYADEVNLDTLASIACLSKFHFLRQFKQYTGMTPHQYWLNGRIARARQALARGIRATDVAHQLGFNDISHFNRRFKPIFGITPHQYQRLIQPQ
ncbi:AraC family transcriptional regulator [Maribrevibacterium harenarium]|uniref:AraC family transcriptional regulator n=1 Tax=Maribrevibacterium harenarium TaxID=2589817 RepID=A0A501WVQ2_9GAMM|nr:AraC family transcriptional regulator [Maribrevibacterium harenarium]TPE53349.1 AraC family transcriptional regulator [Maribrevibacterium harenarium]